MSAKSRNKGAGFEREIAGTLTDNWGVGVTRNLGQARDGGDDITVPPFRIECKRRHSIAVYDWLEQCIAAAEPNEIPVVIARADNKESIVILRLGDFIQLGREELVRWTIK